MDFVFSCFGLWFRGLCGVDIFRSKVGVRCGVFVVISCSVSCGGIVGYGRDFGYDD